MGIIPHEFTWVDYVDSYEKLITVEKCECEIIFTNQAKSILKYPDVVLNCDIHPRTTTKKFLKKFVVRMDEICTV